MPAQAPIQPVQVINVKTVSPCRQEVTDGANSFDPLQFVFISSGALAECASAATAVYGLVPDGSKTATDSPVDAIWGQLHSCISPEPDQNLFIVNISNNNQLIGSGTTTQANVTIGESYGLLLGTGTYDGYNFLNVDNTTNDFFKVENYYTLDGTDAYNGRVICSINRAIIQ